MKDLRINFKETCAIREIELIFLAMEKAAKFGNYKAVLSFSKLLQKRLKQCKDFCFVQSEQQHRGKGTKMGKYKLTIRNNTYVSLYYGEQFIHCYDNCTEYGEEIMAEIEKEQV